MKRPLRLAGTREVGATFRDSYPFPVAAAASLKPSAPRLAATTPLPFPLSHPENLTPRVPTLHSRKGARPAPEMLGVIPTDDLIRQIDATLDRIKASTDDLRDQIETYPFPGTDGDDSPRAA
ncbi:MAG: hypothetical protein AB7G11_08045 [Phycisphaerales bacterium]